MIIIHDMSERHYRPRALTAVVQGALETHPVVVVTGGRQTGKTTLVRSLVHSKARDLVTLDDLDALELAQKRPADLLARASRLTIDEIQRAPELLLSIKKDVDRRRRRGRFLLTGSANLHLMRSVADSLAGRAVYLLLSPFTGGEKRGDGTVPPWNEILRLRDPDALLQWAGEQSCPAVDWRQEVLRGGMPRSVLAHTARERFAWFDGFVKTYLERDLRELSQVASLPDFRRVMGLAVHRVGQLVNQTDLGRDAGLSQPTAHRYLNLLETTYQTQRLPAYSVNPSKRLIKAPKIYWRDTGLAAHLVGLSRSRQLRSSPLAGPLLENSVLSAMTTWSETQPSRPNLFFWRTAGGAEVDFVIEQSRRLLPVEVKSSKRVRLADVKHLETFLADYGDRAPFGIVLHDTSQPHKMTRRIVALPVVTFL
jgi:predicted AAA+ superfamily ATPase